MIIEQFDLNEGVILQLEVN